MEHVKPHTWAGACFGVSEALMQVVLTMAYFKLGQVRDGVGTAGAGFDVLCAGVGCVLGD